MSQRTYMIGFEKSKLERLAGSKDQKAIDDLQSEFNKDTTNSFMSSDEKKDSIKLIKDFINGSIDPKDLELKSSLFTEILRRYLVFYNQNILWTDMEHKGFYEYLGDVLFFVEDKEMKNLFERLYGQTIFSEDDSPYSPDYPYACINNDQVKR